MEKTHFEDSAVIARLRNGEVEAFDVLFFKYSNRLFWFVYKYLQSKEEAEEIVQDVFLKIWNQRKGLDSGRSFNSYIFTIAKNHIFNELRKKVSEKKYLDFQINTNKGTHSPVEKELSFREIIKISNDAIDRLPPRRKLVYQLSRDKGMSYQEIANHLGISVKTVESHMSLALRFLKEYIGREAEISIPMIFLFIQ